MKKIKTVLLIDDDEPTNFINKKILQSSGLAEVIHVVHSGQEALNFLTHEDDQTHRYPFPDLIFLDVNMPAMDGWEFLAHYNKLKDGQKGKIVIVMLTTSLNPDDEAKAKDIKEIAGYKNKPLTRQMIEDIINNSF